MTWAHAISRRVKVRDPRAESGSAIVEFVVLAVLVMVPLAYAVLVVLEVHSATYATVTAAREAGRAYVTADNTSAAAARARAAARIALADQGLPEPHLRITCLDGACLSPGSAISVEVKTTVPIPLIPHGDGRGSIPVSAQHTAPVDSYRRS